VFDVRDVGMRDRLALVEYHSRVVAAAVDQLLEKTGVYLDPCGDTVLHRDHMRVLAGCLGPGDPAFRELLEASIEEGRTCCSAATDS
jgi:hypothetical protein